ncbi:molybdopterin-binding protein [Roseovarius salinarum]|uniref:molybdopterin-binding protein n=1 Tax=Roseovarius salinarum TaxID=1981892 RepID=UPI000C3413FF|nr:molybdopterin-binding protein [Roseovarius salinarum]
MKFGDVPVDEAEGAILAHSLHVADGKLRKGLRLTCDHVAALRAAGLTEVTVARLDAADVHEDTAAARLGAALADGAAQVKLSNPFTGRVNLTAAGPGVVRLDAGQVNAVNAVDPAITVATVPDHRQLAAGGMIATVKIIPYAVPEADLDRAVARGRGAVGLAPPRLSTASLIVTDIPGGPGTKGTQAILDRLTALDVALIETRVCAHEEPALTREIAAAEGEVVLILTGSATSDAADTAPAALRAAGGRLERFGMPVDPGNLLFIGDRHGRPVIGLPGSARSPVLHGVDWVLSRVVCGLPVSAADIAAMGVGGLLKEIPTRPQPRRGGKS